MCILIAVLLTMSCDRTRQKETVMDEKKPIRILIVDGFSNHDWNQTTRAIRQILDQSDLRLSVDVTTTPSLPDSPEWDTWRPDFSKYDVVIQSTNNLRNKSLRWPEQVQLDLEKYVKAGGGLYIFHSANNSFDHWPQYNRMIGLGWRKKEQGASIEITRDQKLLRIPSGQGENTSHGPRVDAVVNILNRHPINSGFPEKWKTTSLEVYTYPRGPAEDITVLSYAYDKPTEKYWPIEWTIKYGRGRVYNSTFGHLWKNEIMPVSFRCIGFQTTLVRAVEWLATERVTSSVPENFPTEDKISLQPTNN